LAVLLIATAVKDALAVKHCWWLQRTEEQVRKQVHCFKKVSNIAGNDAGNIMAALKRSVSCGEGQKSQRLSWFCSVFLRNAVALCCKMHASPATALYVIGTQGKHQQMQLKVANQIVGMHSSSPL